MDPQRAPRGGPTPHPWTWRLGPTVLLVAVLGALAFGVAALVGAVRHGHGGHAAVMPAADGTQVDPVCGMRVRPAPGAPMVADEGRSIHFCSTTCHDAYLANPQRYRPKHPPGAGSTEQRR